MPGLATGSIAAGRIHAWASGKLFAAFPGFPADWWYTRVTLVAATTCPAQNVMIP